MVLIQHLYGIPSLRQTHRDIEVNLAYRWFLGYGLLKKIPHFATVSYAFCNRFPPELAEEIFEHSLNKALNNRMVAPDMVFIDGGSLTDWRRRSGIPERLRFSVCGRTGARFARRTEQRRQQKNEYSLQNVINIREKAATARSAAV